MPTMAPSVAYFNTSMPTESASPTMAPFQYPTGAPTGAPSVNWTTIDPTMYPTPSPSILPDSDTTNEVSIQLEKDMCLEWILIAMLIFVMIELLAGAICFAGYCCGMRGRARVRINDDII